MEGERLTTSDRTLVPNRFVADLHPADLEEFGEMSGSLASELADGALSFARAHLSHLPEHSTRMPEARNAYQE